MADIYFHDIHTNKFGTKVFLDSPFSAKDVIMELDWEKSHRVWNEEVRKWEIDLDAVNLAVNKLRDAGFTVEMDDEVRKHYKTMVEELTDKDKITVTLVIDDDNVTVQDNERMKDIDKLLYTNLSYYIKGAKHVTAYQKRRWDGREHLYYKKTHSAPLGLWKRMKTTLEEEGYNVVIVDEREEPAHDTHKTLDLEWGFEHDFRDYQVQAIKRGLEQKNGVLSLPTGSGKTIVGLRLIYELGYPTIIFVHKIELLYQWMEVIKDVLNYKAGLIGDGNWKEKDITVAMLQSVNSRGVENLKEYPIMIVDETHRCPADTFFDVVSNMDSYYRYGLSATPYRNDNAELRIYAGVGEIAIDVTAEKLVDEGYLAEPVFHTIRWSPEYSVPKNDYEAQRDMMRASKRRNNAIAEKVRELQSEGHKILVDVSRIQHGETLSRLLGAPFLRGTSTTSKRKEIIDEFQNGHLNVIVSTLLNEGVDIPEMTAVVLADSGKSSIDLIQTIGRALRVQEDKSAVIVTMDDREGGGYMIDHTYHREQIIRKYYGKYYKQQSEFEWDMHPS